MQQAGSGVHAGPTARLLMLLASVCVAEMAEERVMSRPCSARCSSGQQSRCSAVSAREHGQQRGRGRICGCRDGHHGVASLTASDRRVLQVVEVCGPRKLSHLWHTTY